MFILVMITCVGFWTCAYDVKDIAAYKTMEQCEIEAKKLRDEGTAAHLICKEKV